ncbi:MAG: mechanosensitive ion channel family protein [Thiopseudomonas sp.]|nr:mechanosensitive ion channel family protein [Thiopseudomonas sp.]
MQTLTELWSQWSSDYPLLETLAYASGLILLSAAVNQVVKKILVRGFYNVLKRITKGHSDDFGVVKRLANIAPALVISSGLHAVPHLPDALTSVILNVVSGFIILTLALALAAVLDVVNFLYNQRPDAHRKPIKGYLQVIKIVLFALATLLIIATLIDRSPLILFSGLGAMAAVLMLIFQDTLLSLVASVQISSGDMIRVGDWVEIPALGVDGDVIDIALHTVKIRNFDKTVTTVPVKRFISDAVKNWRGMQESGGRRIKRSLLIDQQSIAFLDTARMQHLQNFRLMYGYFDSKIDELNQWNERYIHAKAGEAADTRRLTNIGTFRVYIERYLRNHPGVNQDMLQIVRQLQPTANGLPLEVYCFTATTAWAAYEGIQSDIFDHLLAIAPEFGLRVYQAPSGGDFSRLLSP